MEPSTPRARAGRGRSAPPPPSTSDRPSNVHYVDSDSEDDVPTPRAVPRRTRINSFEAAEPVLPHLVQTHTRIRPTNTDRALPLALLLTLPFALYLFAPFETGWTPAAYLGSTTTVVNFASRWLLGDRQRQTELGLRASLQAGLLAAEFMVSGLSLGGWIFCAFFVGQVLGSCCCGRGRMGAVAQTAWLVLVDLGLLIVVKGVQSVYVRSVGL